MFIILFILIPNTIIRSNWNKLFDFYKKNKIQKLELDTFINKKKAIHKIVRMIVPKNNKKHKFHKEKSRKLLYNELEYKKIIKKPTMLAFGKGNGKLRYLIIFFMIYIYVFFKDVYIDHKKNN